VRALLESESRVPEEIELNRLEALAVLARLESMTGSLLAIARHDGAVAAQGAELVDLDEVVLRAVEHATPPAGVAIDVAHVSGGQVRGNEHDLERMVANLVNNAVRHARSRVRITVGERADTVTLVVGDDGPGIAIEDRERIYERFTRLDDARSRDQGGAGLGLPIVRSVVEAHGGTITTGSSALGGAVFVVTLRASTVTSAKPPPAAHAPRPPSTEPHPSRDPSASTSA
jgi:signal transduction histidine kinase